MVPGLGLSRTLSAAALNVGAPGGTSTTLTYLAQKPGTYRVTITATHGTMIRTRMRGVYVNDFSVSLTPASVTVLRGNAARFTLTITPAETFNSPVNLTINRLRPRDTVMYTHNPAPGHGSQTITIRTSKLDAKGTLTVLLTAVSGPFRHSAVAKLVLQ